MEAPYEIWLQLDQWLQRRRCFKMLAYDGWRTMDGGPCLYYKLTSEPKGSGELKTHRKNALTIFALNTLRTCTVSELTITTNHTQSIQFKWFKSITSSFSPFFSSWNLIYIVWVTLEFYIKYIYNCNCTVKLMKKLICWVSSLRMDFCVFWWKIKIYYYHL